MGVKIDITEFVSNLYGVYDKMSGTKRATPVDIVNLVRNVGGLIRSVDVEPDLEPKSENLVERTLRKSREQAEVALPRGRCWGNGMFLYSGEFGLVWTPEEGSDPAEHVLGALKYTGFSPLAKSWRMAGSTTRSRSRMRGAKHWQRRVDRFVEVFGFDFRGMDELAA